MRAHSEKQDIMTKWLAILGAVAVLAACSHVPAQGQASAGPWNGGTWNSVLGYHGPDNAMVVSAP